MDIHLDIVQLQCIENISGTLNQVNKILVPLYVRLLGEQNSSASLCLTPPTDIVKLIKLQAWQLPETYQVRASQDMIACDNRIQTTLNIIPTTTREEDNVDIE